MRIVTVSQEFGSGGRELGKRLADDLGIAYYDKEILTKIAENLELDPEYIEKALDRSFTVRYPYNYRRSFSLPPASQAQPNLLAEQAKIICELARKSDCVIVGRAADVLTREHSPFNIFVYADTPAKLLRCRERAAADEQLSEREMLRRMKRIDAGRAANYALVG